MYIRRETKKHYIMETKNLGFDTKLIHSGDIDDKFGSAIVPIYQTSTFAVDNSKQGSEIFKGEKKGYVYTRIGNPTLEALENKLAELEKGYKSIVTSSGMAAITTVFMDILKKGDHIVSTDAVYGPSRKVIENHFAKFGIEYSYIDTSVISNISKAVKSNTKILYIESPANPTMTLTDIAEACKIAHKHNILVVVDNTFCSPYLQLPLELGADIVVHSLTKFINGHADIIGGVIVTKEKKTYASLRNTMILMGCNMDPHQAFLVMRGVKTLSLRIEKAQQNALEIARFLKNHPKVKWIKYPGLISCKQHDLAEKQMKGPGTMISFGLKGGFEAGVKLMDNVKIAMLAVSLGGVETLIQHPASMTHAGVPYDERQKAHITDDMVRYSVGIENAEDLISDLAQAMEKI